MKRAAGITSIAFAVGLALGLAGSSARAQGDNVAFAQQRFERGVELYNARQFDQALTEFNASLALYESPNTMLFVARTLRALGRLDEALPAYRRAAAAANELAARAPRYAPTAEAARTEMEALLPRLGSVVLRLASGAELPAGARVRVAGRAVPREAIGLAIPATPGAVSVDIEADGYANFHTSVTVEAQHEASVNIVLAPPETRTTTASTSSTTPNADHASAPTPTPHIERPATELRVGSVPGWAALGVGTAGFVAAGVLWSAAVSQHQSLEQSCGASGPCTTDHNAEVQNGRTLQTATDVALAVGAVGAVAGLALLVVGTGRHPVRREISMEFDGRSVILGGTF